MMNQTALFLATVKTIRLRIKAQQRESGSLNNSTILTKSSHKQTKFSQEANDVATCISKLQEFLLKHRKNYINSVGHITSRSLLMTDTERDQIDSEAQDFIRSCSERIQCLKDQVSSISVGQQTRDHRHVVFELLREYLKAVCKLYSEQKAIRVKRIVDRKRTSRLQPEGYKRLSSLSPAGDTHLAHEPATVMDLQKRSVDGPSDDSEALNERLGPDGSGNDQGMERVGLEEVPFNAANLSPTPIPSGDGTVHHHGNGINDVVDELTEEERRIFEQENAQMFEEMHTMVDEVRQVEGRVIEISRLQEIFAEKILVQAKQLETVADQTVTASENVTGGNEQIRQAIKNKASFRLWILFVLAVCSFSLLFLDWYS